MALPTDRTTANTRAEHVADHNTLHALHNEYEGTEPADFEPAGTASTAVSAHEAAGNPHAGYATDSDLSTHAGAVDPHSVYRLESVLIAAADVAADVATQAELDVLSALLAKVAANRYSGAAGSYVTRGGTPGTVLLVNGNLLLTPYWLPRDLDRISLNVTGAAILGLGTCELRFVVYADTGSYAPDVANAPLAQASVSIGTSTGDQFAALSVTGGQMVWAGVVGQGAPTTQATVRSVGAVTEPMVISTVPTGNTAPNTLYTGLTGSIPTPIGVGPTAHSLAVPRIGLRMV